MMKTNGNEPIYIDREFGNVGAGGLTKREYFAALAMQGMLASLTVSRSNGWAPDKTEIVSYCKEAVQFADALIEELNKKSI